MLSNIRIVLVETSHPGNIGAVARAMKTMGLYDLYLVNPKKYPHSEAGSRAAHAIDVLEKAKVVDTFLEAVGDCQLVIGTSARLRKLPWPLLEPREAAAFVYDQPQESKIAIVFGRENNGLTNEELALCQYQICIPTNPEYGILNIASAVQIITYELFLASGQQTEKQVQEKDRLSVEEMESFYQHLNRVLVAIDFVDEKQPDMLMRRLRRFFNQAKPDKDELNILRGMLTNVESMVRKIS